MKRSEKLTKQLIKRIINLNNAMPISCNFTMYIHPKTTEEMNIVINLADELKLKCDDKACRTEELFHIVFFKP